MEQSLIFDDKTRLEMEVNISTATGVMNATWRDDSDMYARRTVQDWPEYVAAVWLVKYLLFLIILLGTVGNTLSMCVLMRRRMRHNSINFYLALLSCADTTALYLSGFKTWLRVVSGFELLHVSNAGCKIVIFLFMFAAHASAWIIVLVTADRFVAVWFPFRAAILCSVRRARITGSVLLAATAIYNAHLFWTTHLYEVGNGNKQCAPYTTNEFMNGPFNYIRLATYTIIPFVTVLTMNTGIIICICNHSKKSVSDPLPVSFKGVHSADQRLQHNKHQVTVMLLVVSFTWLLLTTPYTVICLVNFKYPTTHARAATFLGKTVSFLLMYLNHSINFLLYCIAGKKFRAEVLNMFQDLNASIRWKRRNTWSLSDRTFRTTRSRKPVTTAKPGDRSPGEKGVQHESFEILRAK